jgi:hypothetical protein
MDSVHLPLLGMEAESLPWSANLLCVSYVFPEPSPVNVWYYFHCWSRPSMQFMA